MFGEVNPCGKLAETWPISYTDVHSYQTFGKGINEVYSEGVEIGYRYYAKHDIPVRYPFGHGLSYTRFSISEWQKEGDVYTATVTNVGDRYGAEVAQLYLNGELRGFKKVWLNAGESFTVSIIVENEEKKDYSDELTIPAEPKRFPITLESRFTDLKQTFMGRILFNAVMSVSEKQRKQALKMPDGVEKANKLKGARFLRRILESNSLRSMSMTAGSSLPYNFAEGFADLANRRIISGVKHFLTKIKVPPLPKDENK